MVTIEMMTKWLIGKLLLQTFKPENNEENWLDTQLRPNNKADSGNSSWRTKNIQSRDRAKTEHYNNQD